MQLSCLLKLLSRAWRPPFLGEVERSDIRVFSLAPYLSNFDKFETLAALFLVYKTGMALGSVSSG